MAAMVTSAVQSKLWWCIALVVSGQLPLHAGPTSGGPPTYPPICSVNLGWNPSPDSEAAGYLLLWGQASGIYTSQLDAGNASSTTVTGLVAGVTYYFNIVAYDNTGAETPPSSSELIYTVPTPPPPELQVAAQTGGTLGLTWSAVVGQRYQLQRTTNLNQSAWAPIGVPISATNTMMTAVDIIGPDPQRFYRVVLVP